MEAIILLFYCVLFWYLLNIFWLIVGFSKVPVFRYKQTTPKTKFTVIVPFRNEKETLPKLLHSIEKLNYPSELFEVILVDDDSTDGWKTDNERWKLIKNIRKTNSPKKDAINTAIAIAKNEWIITTDADCEVPENWLATFDFCIQKEKPRMIASGVVYRTENSILDTFQQMDLLSLQGTTIGSFGNQQAFMCNGANFCYEKSLFQELNGFEGNDLIASGDDVFLLQKAISREVKSVHFLKSYHSVVTTKTEKTWKNSFLQRVRWASKTANYKSIYSKQLGLSVFLINLILVAMLFIFWFSEYELQLFVWFFAIKLLIDFILLKQTAVYFKKPLRYLILCSLIYPFFSSAVVFYSFFGKYSWKGRTFKK